MPSLLHGAAAASAADRASSPSKAAAHGLNGIRTGGGGFGAGGFGSPSDAPGAVGVTSISGWLDKQLRGPAYGAQRRCAPDVK